MDDQVAWIETLPPNSWTGELLQLRERVTDLETGIVDHIMQVHSLAPAGLAAHLALYTHAMAGTGGLRKVDREMVALVVSGLNGCHY